MKRTYALLTTAALTVAAGLWGAGTSRAEFAPDASAIRVLITRHDTSEAARLLEFSNRATPAIATENARLRLYTGDCDRVAAAAELVTHDEETDHLVEIGQGCARVTAGVTVLTDAPSGIEVRFQDETDQAMFPLIVDTVVRSRAMLERELGADWPHPTRIVVVRDQLSLSAMTGLPYAAAKTTGTAAVAKWGKVTMISPRAMGFGFDWRDTLAHELTHLALTRLTIDRAPLWLQEGFAKRQQVRWRDPSPFDARINPELTVRNGIAKKLDLPLDKLGNSLATLPSAQQASVAYAEVESFCGFLLRETSVDAVRTFFSELKSVKTVDEALKKATSAPLGDWERRWRAWLLTLPAPAPKSQVARAAAGTRKLSERVRLFELLERRGERAAALVELGDIGGAPFESRAGTLRGRGLEAAGKAEEAWALAQPEAVTGGAGPWWALRARLSSTRDAGMSLAASERAVSEDPFGFEAACQARPFTEPPEVLLRPALCAASRVLDVPPSEP
jgi:hypothetical protein